MDTKQEEQDRVGYTVFYPKNMDEMNYDELSVIFNETMEALVRFIAHDVFKDSNTVERQHPFDPEEE